MQHEDSKVELSIACKNLLDKDVFSKSDPMAVLFQQTAGNKNNWLEVGRTERISNNLNPVFQKKFVLNYHFAQCQRYKIALFDVDNRSENLSGHDKLGHYEFTLGDVVSRRQIEAVLNYDSSIRKSGSLLITAVELEANKEEITFKFEATNLDNKDFFSKSDPFFEIYRADSCVPLESAYTVKNYTLVYRSEVIDNNLNPSWRSFILPLNVLCLGNKSLPLRIDCYDADSDGSRNFIGRIYTTYNQLFEQFGNAMMRGLIFHNEKKAKKKGKSYKGSGNLIVKQFQAVQLDTFVQYIQGGCQLNFTVGIDFTASNGDPHYPNSLHYISPQSFQQPNQYELAILSVGEVIEAYDHDKQFPVLGFGAILQGHTQPLFDFAVNFQPTNPFCAGIQGILNAYRHCILQVRLYGPTNFSPLIRHVMKFASEHQDGSNYFVLLLLTDGEITDMNETVKTIIDASSLPMSLIIVGVGNDQFAAMEFLDSDNKRLQYGGRAAVRDIVQFVPLNKFLGSSNQEMAKLGLAKAVLEELPNQVCEWMKSKGIRAKPPSQQIFVLENNSMSTASSFPPQSFNNQTVFQPNNSAFNPSSVQTFNQNLPPVSQTPYLSSGQATFTQGAQAPYIPGGQAPYASGGQASYIPGGQAPYTPGGQATYASGGQAHLIPGGQAPYTLSGQAPYSPVATAPYPSGGQGPASYSTNRHETNPPAPQL